MIGIWYGFIIENKKNIENFIIKVDIHLPSEKVWI